MFTVNPVVVIDDTFINPAVAPDIVAVTFGADANAVLNVIFNVPELVVPDPYKYLVILIDDTFAVIDDTFIFIEDTFTASVSMPAVKVLGTVEAQVMEVDGK